MINFTSSPTKHTAAGFPVNGPPLKASTMKIGSSFPSFFGPSPELETVLMAAILMSAMVVCRPLLVKLCQFLIRANENRPFMESV